MGDDERRLIGHLPLFVLGLGVLLLGARISPFLLYSLALIVGPGLLAQRALRLELDGFGRVAVWIGLSVTLVPLLYLWATALGLALSRYAIFVLLLGLYAGIVIALRPAISQLIYGPRPRPPLWLLSLLVVIGALIASRLAHAEGLLFPPWVDSLHHGLMIRVVAERGVVPSDLRPYVELEQLNYHWGYHALGGTLFHAAGLALPQLMLALGQLLNVLAVVALGCAVASLWRQQWAASWAIAVGGLCSTMPAFYLGWGRYTLLDGQAALPAALLLTVMLARTARWREGLALALLLAGLSTIHMASIVLALLWVGAVVMTGIGDHPFFKKMLGLGAAVALAGALAAPWLLALLNQVQFTSGARPPYVFGNAVTNDLNLPMWFVGDNRWLMVLALHGALLLVRWRRRLVATALVWWALALLSANLNWLGLRPLSFFTNLMAAISVFVPLALVIGGALGNATALLLGRLRPRWAQALGQLALAAALLIPLWHGAGGFELKIRFTNFGRADDLPALEWAARNTPQDAHFLINSTPWLFRIARGVDGGWWLLPLTGRQTSVPPVVYTYGDSEVVESLLLRAVELSRANEFSAAETADAMRRYGFDYVYATPGGPQFKVEPLRAASEFEEVYTGPGVSVFRLKLSP